MDAEKTQLANAAARKHHPKADDPIAAGLRRMWADAEKEPVPDDLLALLDAIATGISAGNKPAPGDES